VNILLAFVVNHDIRSQTVHLPTALVDQSTGITGMHCIAALNSRRTKSLGSIRRVPVSSSATPFLPKNAI
jgi:hypothetical protein